MSSAQAGVRPTADPRAGVAPIAALARHRDDKVL